MRAESIVRQVLADVGTEIHRTRLNAVIAAVLALIHGGQVGLTALGRAIGARSHKHGIKRIDRLLGNRALANELDTIYEAIARYVTRGICRPVILIDWTESGKSTRTLTAAVPINGRAITIFSKTVPVSQYSARHVENAFMDTLRTFFGADCRPILVGDAGFRAPWMKRVRLMGWDFVARIRGRTQVQRVGETNWQRWTNLFPKARCVPKSLGAYRVVRNHGVEVELVVVDPRKRKRKRPRGAARSRNAPAMRARRAYAEPWVLATTLTLPASQIVDLYAARMQIELTFRDLKSHRFGWAFEDARSSTEARVAVQILLAAIASLVALLVGLAAEAAGMHKKFQANTISHRRVLSLVSLGRAVIKHVDGRLPIPALREYLPFVGIR